MPPSINPGCRNHVSPSMVGHVQGKSANLCTNAKNVMEHTPRHSAKHQTPTNLNQDKTTVTWPLPVCHGDRNVDIVSPVKCELLRSWLQGYNHDEIKFLVDGFRHGFAIPFIGQRQQLRATNLKSAIENMPVLRQKIQIELTEGRVSGPYSVPPFPNFRVSPLGLVPKKNSGEFRVIHHLSYPEGTSVNDGIPSEFCSVQYQDIDEQWL